MTLRSARAAHIVAAVSISSALLTGVAIAAFGSDVPLVPTEAPSQQLPGDRAPR